MALVDFTQKAGGQSVSDITRNRNVQANNPRTTPGTSMSGSGASQPTIRPVVSSPSTPSIPARRVPGQGGTTDTPSIAGRPTPPPPSETPTIPARGAPPPSSQPSSPLSCSPVSG